MVPSYLPPANTTGVEDDDAGPAPLPDRDFNRYWGYWHGFSFIIFDEQHPDQWIQSTYWVAVGDEGNTAEEGD